MCWSWRWLISLACTLCTMLPTAAAAEKKDRFYFERLGYAHGQVPTHKKVVALTFDDGPDQRYTPEVLQLLADEGDHATFFLIGKKVNEHPEIARQTVLLGNELGNHTFSHRHIKNMSEKDLCQELITTNAAIFRATGQHAKYFRPPRGFYDEPSVLTEHRLGYSVVLWSWDEDGRDWQGPGVDKIVNTVLQHLHPGDIILLHDGIGNSKQTVAALRVILPALHAKGYHSVTVSELLHCAENDDQQNDDDDD